MSDVPGVAKAYRELRNHLVGGLEECSLNPLLYFDGRVVSREWVLHKSHQVLLDLKQLDVGAGDTVRISVGNAAWPAYPAAYLAALRSNASVALGAPQGGGLSRTPVDNETVGIRIDSVADDCSFSSTTVRYCKRPLGGSHYQSVVATSGTSGVPKSAPVDLSAWLEAAKQARRETCALFAPPGSTAAHSVLLSTIISGGALATIPTWDPDAMQSVVHESRAETLFLAPGTLRSLLKYRLLDLDCLESVSNIRLGMAPVDGHLYSLITEKLPGRLVTNVYTSTELWPLGGTCRRMDDSHPTFRPFPGTEVRIAPSATETAMPDDVGILQFRTLDSDAWVTAGDIGSVDASGVFTVAGRPSEIVTDGGSVISFAAIEECILRIDEVDAVRVYRAPGTGCEGNLLCDIDAAGMSVTDTQVRAVVSRAFGGAAVPRSIRFVDRLAPTDGGKKLLPTIENAERTLSPNRGDSLSRVSAIWCELLEVEELTPDANFFDLGGDSLSAVICNGELQARYGLEVPLSYHFDHPELAGFCRAVELLAAESK